MKAIGGYFQLELNQRQEYHHDAIRLNSGRNALEYILRTKKYAKIYIPYFTCEVILEPIEKLGIEYIFYTIDDKLEPVFNYEKIQHDEAFLYTNYFGLKDDFVIQLSKKGKNIIIDNAQSFFSKPLENIDTFYSPRKFFGVSDGSYLFTDKKLNENFETDISSNRMLHLLVRADSDAEEGYKDFITNEATLKNQSIKRMSQLTQRILSSIDYKLIKKKRQENFIYLHTSLSQHNFLKFNISTDSVPMIYPFWFGDKLLRKNLINNKIFCPIYWPNVARWCNESTLERKLVNEIIYLPIDQRYSKEQLNIILKIIWNEHSR